MLDGKEKPELRGVAVVRDPAHHAAAGEARRPIAHHGRKATERLRDVEHALAPLRCRGHEEGDDLPVRRNDIQNKFLMCLNLKCYQLNTNTC